jgi:EAL domain-containing protein (putative c-di-GMP-specific phosphodiesterase class I)
MDDFGVEAIVRTIASLRANFGMETTAEGVETAEQLELVRKTGCTEAQGFHFGRPCAASEVFRDRAVEPERARCLNW